jgi:hypothetical protein
MNMLLGLVVFIIVLILLWLLSLLMVLGAWQFVKSMRDEEGAWDDDL